MDSVSVPHTPEQAHVVVIKTLAEMESIDAFSQQEDRILAKYVGTRLLPDGVYVNVSVHEHEGGSEIVYNVEKEFKYNQDAEPDIVRSEFEGWIRAIADSVPIDHNNTSDQDGSAINALDRKKEVNNINKSLYYKLNRLFDSEEDGSLHDGNRNTISDIATSTGSGGSEDSYNNKTTNSSHSDHLDPELLDEINPSLDNDETVHYIIDIKGPVGGEIGSSDDKKITKEEMMVSSVKDLAKEFASDAVTVFTDKRIITGYLTSFSTGNPEWFIPYDNIDGINVRGGRSNDILDIDKDSEKYFDSAVVIINEIDDEELREAIQFLENKIGSTKE